MSFGDKNVRKGVRSFADGKEYAAQASNVAEKVLMINSICESPASISHGGTFYFKSGDTISELPYDAEDVLLVEV